MAMEPSRLIRDYLPDIFHLSLATSANNKPWICELHFVYDDNLNLYFLSKPNRRHSKEIAANPNVAGNIVKQHNATQVPRGVYFEGKAMMLADVNKDSLAYNLYVQRFSIGPEMLSEIIDQPEGHKLYKIAPELFVLFDPVNFPDNPRQEWLVKK